MTGPEFLAYVKRKFIRGDKDTEIYESTTDTIALMEMKFSPDDNRSEEYISGISTVGEYRIGLPTDFVRIIGNVSIIDTSDDCEYPNLQKISKQTYDRLYTDRILSDVGNVHTDLPRHFCIYDGQLYLGPVPDKITYRYQCNFITDNTTAISASTTTVPFSTEFRERTVLRNGVLFELHDGMENFDEAAYYKSLFLDGVRDLETLDERNRGDSLNVQYRGI